MLNDPVLLLLVASRWVHFVAVFVVFGASLFWITVGSGPVRRALPRTFRRTLSLLAIAAPVAAVSGLAWLAASIAYAVSGFGSLVDPDTLRGFFLQPPFGPPFSLRLALMAALVLAAFVPLASRVRVVALVLVGGALLASQAWTGHAAEGGPYGAAMLGSYAVHVLAAAAWTGGLPVLGAALAEGRREGYARAMTVQLLSRYATMATVAVVLILASGTANTAFHVGGDVTGLRSSAYGHVLLAKVALVAAMLGLAALNRFAFLPRLRRDPTRSGTWARAVRVSVALDTVLALLVLGAAAVLGVTPPPH